MITAIVDYNSGNLRSAEKSFQRMAEELNAGEILVTPDPDQVRKADRVVLPGVGAFADCRRELGAIDGLFGAIEEKVKAEKAKEVSQALSDKTVSTPTLNTAGALTDLLPQFLAAYGFGNEDADGNFVVQFSPASDWSFKAVARADRTALADAAL